MDRALPADDLRPQRPGGLGRGALLAIAAHVGLIVALAIGVNWRASEPASVSAELWAQVPEAAAPRIEAPAPAPTPKPEPAPPPAAPAPQPAVAPPTPSRDAEIALEAQKKKQAAEQRARELAEDKRKADAERREKERELADAKKKADAQREREVADARRKKAEAEERERVAEAKRQKAEEEAQSQRVEAQRKANLERMQAQAGGTGAPAATSRAARDAGPSASYAGRIVARIRPNIVLVDSVAGNPMAAVEVRAAPDGSIVARRLTKGSGNAAWDQAVLRAIDRTEILPRDVDGRVPSLITIEFRPRD